MAKAPAFQFYSADWFIDTAQMSRAAKGLHIDLLAIQWSNGFIECDINGNPVALSGDDLALFRLICGKYSVTAPGKLQNLKLEEVRAKQLKFSAKQREKGLKGGRPKPDQSQSKAKPNPEEIQMKAIIEDEVEDVDEVVDEIQVGGTGEGWNQFPKERFDLNEIEIGSCAEFIHLTKHVTLSVERIKDFWVAFQINQFTGQKFYETRTDAVKHFRDWLKFQDFDEKVKRVTGQHTQAKPEGSFGFS